MADATRARREVSIATLGGDAKRHRRESLWRGLFFSAAALSIVISVAIVVSLAIWVRSTAGWIALPLVTALVHPRMRWGSPGRRMVFTQLIGVTLAIDTVSRSG